jgi:hypothetical protein
MKMSKCPDCNKEMQDRKVKSCKHNGIVINGKLYRRDTQYYDVNVRCHDCNILNMKGNLHHFGCDMERCPKCKGQLLSCDCKKEALVRISGYKEID